MQSTHLNQKMVTAGNIPDYIEADLENLEIKAFVVEKSILRSSTIF